MRTVWFLVVCALVGLGTGLASVDEARADIRLCNQNTESLTVSVVFEAQSGWWQTSGWYDTDPGKCTTMIKGESGDNRYFMLIAAWNAVEGKFQSIEAPHPSGDSEIPWAPQGTEVRFCINSSQAFQNSSAGLAGLQQCPAGQELFRFNVLIDVPLWTQNDRYEPRLVRDYYLYFGGESPDDYVMYGSVSAEDVGPEQDPAF